MDTFVCLNFFSPGLSLGKTHKVAKLSQHFSPPHPSKDRINTFYLQDWSKSTGYFIGSE